MEEERFSIFVEDYGHGRTTSYHVMNRTLTDFYIVLYFFLFQIDLKQELQVRQKAIHETPDNEKHEKAAVDENEKSDPTKSPLAYPSSNNNNKLPSSAPLKCKHSTLFLIVQRILQKLFIFLS